MMGEWEGPHDVEVWRIRAGALQAELDASRDRVSQLEAALRDISDAWDTTWTATSLTISRARALVDEGTEGTPA